MPVAGSAAVERPEAAAVVLDGEGQRALAAVESHDDVPGLRMALDVGQRLAQHAQDDRGDLGLRRLDRRAGAQLDGQPPLTGALARRQDGIVQAADRHARGEVLQARADDPVRGTHRLAQARAALRRPLGAGIGIQERDLALGQREILGQAVVHVGRQAQALALDLGARDALAQARGRDARSEQVPEDGQHAGARLLERQRVALRGGDHAQDLVAGVEWQHEPGRGGPVEGVGHEPGRRLVKDQGAPAGRGQPPRLLLEAQLVDQRDRVDVRAGHGEAAQDRHVVGLGEVERGDPQAEGLTHRREGVLGQLAEVAGADQGARDRADGGDRGRGLDGRGQGRLSRHH